MTNFVMLLQQCLTPRYSTGIGEYTATASTVAIRTLGKFPVNLGVLLTSYGDELKELAEKLGKSLEDNSEIRIRN